MNPIKAAIAGIVLLLVIVLFMMTYFTVEQNEVAVVTRYGKLQYVADAGLHFKLPFVNSATEYRTDIQALTPDRGINTYTIDNQEVDVIFTVFYRIPPQNAEYIFTNNRDYSTRLFSMTVDRIKAGMGQVNVQSVAEKRGELRDSIKATLAHDALTLGLEITDFQLTDMQYTDAFRTAVNNAAVQKANIEAVEYQRQQAEKTAQMVKIAAEGSANAARAKAQGDADSTLFQAQADAQAKKLKGDAEAGAIAAQANALKANPDLVNLRRAEKWDGKLPTSIYAGAPIPFLKAE